MRIPTYVRQENISTNSKGQDYVNIWMMAHRNAKAKRVLTAIDALDSSAFRDDIIKIIINNEGTEAFWENIGQIAGIPVAKRTGRRLWLTRAEVRRRLIARQES